MVITIFFQNATMCFLVLTDSHDSIRTKFDMDMNSQFLEQVHALEAIPPSLSRPLSLSPSLSHSLSMPVSQRAPIKQTHAVVAQRKLMGGFVSRGWMVETTKGSIIKLMYLLKSK